MPGGDRTGPMGQGPMTGRAAGYCTGAGAPGFMTPSPGRGGFQGAGRGHGGGRGGGRGWRHCYYATGLPGWARPGFGGGYFAPQGAPYAPVFSREQEIAQLKEQAKYFSETLGWIDKRISELGSQDKEE